MMNVHTINDFLASTCVLIVVAYLLTRAPFVALLAPDRRTVRQSLLLGIVFGIVGVLELIFASERFPYDTYTLIVTLAALRGGWRTGFVTAGCIAVAAICFLTEPALARTLLSVLCSAGIGVIVRTRMPSPSPSRPFWTLVPGSVLAIILAEVVAIALRLLLGHAATAPFSLPFALLRIGANSFGAILLQMLLNDALAHLSAERFRVEAERNRTLAVEAQLSALRARVHPHFLFNALNSIAALCRIAPERAEEATVLIGRILRRALESGPEKTVPLTEEIEYVRDYLEIEKLRFGDRLKIVWEIDAAAAARARVPSFALQTLVENAILHGVAPKVEPGTVRITVRRSPDHVSVAVTDDGVGIPAEALPGVRSGKRDDEPVPRLHGLQITTQHLRLLYGPTARLRVFSRPDRGTRVVFRLPLGMKS